MSDGEALSVALRDALAGGWFDRATRQMYPGFDIPADSIVLDAGCGDGHMAGFCAPLAARLILVDIDAASVAAAIAHTRANGANHVEGHTSNCTPIPLADAVADRIVCTEMLEHADDPTAVMAELVRVAKPGARFLLTVPAAESEIVQKRVAPEFYWQKPLHLRIFDHDGFAKLVTDAGLTIERRGRYGFYQSVWWSMFWACGTPFEGPHHPALLAWEASWGALLDSVGGARVKLALDAALPKSQLIVASK